MKNITERTVQEVTIVMDTKCNHKLNPRLRTQKLLYEKIFDIFGVPEESKREKQNTGLPVCPICLLIELAQAETPTGRKAKAVLDSFQKLREAEHSFMNCLEDRQGDQEEVGESGPIQFLELDAPTDNKSPFGPANWDDSDDNLPF